MRYRQERMSVILNPCNLRIFVSDPLAPQSADAERTSTTPLTLLKSTLPSCFFGMVPAISEAF